MTIEVDPESELARILAEAVRMSAVLVSNGALSGRPRRRGSWAGYDPEKVHAGLREAAGTLTPEEGERLNALIYRGREDGTRSLDWP